MILLLKFIDLSYNCTIRTRKNFSKKLIFFRFYDINKEFEYNF